MPSPTISTMNPTMYSPKDIESPLTRVNALSMNVQFDFQPQSKVSIVQAKGGSTTFRKYLPEDRIGLVTH
jgi:hypothetical protein